MSAVLEMPAINFILAIGQTGYILSLQFSFYCQWKGCYWLGIIGEEIRCQVHSAVRLRAVVKVGCLIVVDVGYQSELLFIVNTSVKP